ncbi:hypothetical protein M1589_02605 [Candidatus Marsarchaeota archaeon]|jgi:hypothetical protein|nr:hypothetical protein [Candidatus Marsarchaeota archaeon]
MQRTAAIKREVSADVASLKERLGNLPDFSRVTTFDTNVWTDQFESSAAGKDRDFLRSVLIGYFNYAISNPSKIFVDISNERWAEMLDSLPNDLILAPMMIKGYELGRLTGYTLSTLKKRFDIAFLGCHKSAVLSRDGSKIFSEHELYAGKEDELLIKSSNKPLLVVDDVCEFFSFSSNVALRFGTNRDIFFLFGMEMPEAMKSAGAEHFEKVAYDSESGKVLYKWRPIGGNIDTDKKDIGTTDPVANWCTNGKIGLKFDYLNQFKVLELFHGRIASGRDVQEPIELSGSGAASHIGVRTDEFIVTEAVDKPFRKTVRFDGLLFNVPREVQGMINTAIVLSSNKVKIDIRTGNVTGEILKTVEWPTSIGWYKTDELGVPYNKKSSWEEKNSVYLRRARTESFIGALVRLRGGIGVLGNRRRGIDALYGPNQEFGIALRTSQSFLRHPTTLERIENLI